MHVSQFVADKATGQISIKAKKVEPGREHAPRSRRKSATRKGERDMHERSKRTQNAVIIGRPMKARKGESITRPEQTGTGGNAVRAIPTGPLNGRPVTGNPIRIYEGAKIDGLKARLPFAKIEKSAALMVARVIDAALSRAGYPGQEHKRIAPEAAVVRIDGLTKEQWKAIDSVKLSNRAMKRAKKAGRA